MEFSIERLCLNKWNEKSKKSGSLIPKAFLKLNLITGNCYETLWTWTIFIFFFLLFSDFIGILFFFSFLFFLVMMKRHVTLQSHDMSHDVTS